VAGKRQTSKGDSQQNMRCDGGKKQHGRVAWSGMLSAKFQCIRTSHECVAFVKSRRNRDGPVRSSSFQYMARTNFPSMIGMTWHRTRYTKLANLTSNQRSSLICMYERCDWRRLLFAPSQVFPNHRLAAGTRAGLPQIEKVAAIFTSTHNLVCGLAFR